MKYRIFAYVQLVVLVFYIVRPVMPYVEYALSKEYITKNLCIDRFEPHNCCEGKCYLEKQIKKSNDNNDPQDNNSNKKVQNDVVKEFLSPHVTISKVFESNIFYLVSSGTPIIPRYIATIFVPPKA